MINYFIYCRKSTEDEERQILSIEAIAERVVDLLRPIVAGNGTKGTEDVVFDTQILAEYLKVSRKWIYERTHLQEIPYIKVNSLLRFRKKDIDKWLESYKIIAIK